MIWLTLWLLWLKCGACSLSKFVRNRRLTILQHLEHGYHCVVYGCGWLMPKQNIIFTVAHTNNSRCWSKVMVSYLCLIFSVPFSRSVFGFLTFIKTINSVHSLFSLCLSAISMDGRHGDVALAPKVGKFVVSSLVEAVDSINSFVWFVAWCVYLYVFLVHGEHCCENKNFTIHSYGYRC